MRCREVHLCFVTTKSLCGLILLEALLKTEVQPLLKKQLPISSPSFR